MLLLLGFIDLPYLRFFMNCNGAHCAPLPFITFPNKLNGPGLTVVYAQRLKKRQVPNVHK
ncbi:MAG: hypothetical protein CMI26_11680 [Opitutae bacterium]|nr:hypothetical protein [Opitutae bacterium]|tara:strand:- start:7217 stop:7396 length:180 start_codon:yes stop_codon:yes gene_type:complete